MTADVDRGHRGLGSFGHFERLTLQHADRALRSQGSGAEGNAARRVHTRDVAARVRSKPDRKDFYLCDNILEGRLARPLEIMLDEGLRAL